MALNIFSLTIQQQISTVYLCYFGRCADPSGFNYWISDYNNLKYYGYSDIEILINQTNAFAPQMETISNYEFMANPLTASIADVTNFLNDVYTNLFNRLPDPGGLAYWSNEIFARLSTGQYVGDILVTIANGAQGTDVSTLLNKVDVSLYYSSNIGNLFTLESATVSALNTTSDINSVNITKQDIDQFIVDGGGQYVGGRSQELLLVSDISGGELYLINPFTHTSSLFVDTNLSTITDIAVAQNGDIYITSFDELYKFDIADKALYPIGSHNLTLNALEFSSDGTLYGAGPNSTVLWEIDPDNALPTFVMDTGRYSAGDLSFIDGDLYLSTTSGELRHIDLNTLTAETSGFHGVQGLWGLAYTADNTLFGVAKDQVFLINPSDASVSLVGTFPFADFEQASGASFVYDHQLLL